MAQSREVLLTAAQRGGWDARAGGDGTGMGMGLARYKNGEAYAAVLVGLQVDDATAQVGLDRIVIAADAGQVVDPDGLRNQLEGGAVQSASWTLKERVTFDRREVTSVDWDTYPILRFDAVPDNIDVHIINRPGLPFLGSGETGQGPAAASIANAIANATGKRLRDLPLSRKRIKAAIDA